MLLVRAAHPAEPLLDMALSHALLERVAAGGEEVAGLPQLEGGDRVALISGTQVLPESWGQV